MQKKKKKGEVSDAVIQCWQVHKNPVMCRTQCAGALCPWTEPIRKHSPFHRTERGSGESRTAARLTFASATCLITCSQVTENQAASTQCIITKEHFAFFSFQGWITDFMENFRLQVLSCRGSVGGDSGDWVNRGSSIIIYIMETITTQLQGFSFLSFFLYRFLIIQYCIDYCWTVKLKWVVFIALPHSLLAQCPCCCKMAIISW